MATAKTFDVAMPDDVDPEREFENICKKAGTFGISLAGDAEAGSFSGTAEGTYRREGDRLVFEVTKKPFFVTWSMVESGMRKVFGDVTVS